MAEIQVYAKISAALYSAVPKSQYSKALAATAPAPLGVFNYVQQYESCLVPEGTIFQNAFTHFHSILRYDCVKNCDRHITVAVRTIISSNNTIISLILTFIAIRLCPHQASSSGPLFASSPQPRVQYALYGLSN